MTCEEKKKTQHTVCTTCIKKEKYIRAASEGNAQETLGTFTGGGLKSRVGGRIFNSMCPCKFGTAITQPKIETEHLEIMLMLI